MKTDLIEIFQTIRATLQPYTTLGFNDGANSDQKYDLWAASPAEKDGEEKSGVFFLSIEIKEDHVAFELLPDAVAQHERTLLIKELDEVTLNLIEDKVAAGYKIFKEHGWV